MAHCGYRHVADILVELPKSPVKLEVSKQPDLPKQQLGVAGTPSPHHRLRLGQKTHAGVLTQQTDVVGRAVARGPVDPSTQMEDDAQEREAGRAPAQSTTRGGGGHTAGKDVARKAHVYWHAPSSRWRVSRREGGKYVYHGSRRERAAADELARECGLVDDVKIIYPYAGPAAQALTRLRELTEAYDGALPADLADLGRRCGLRLEITPLCRSQHAWNLPIDPRLPQ